MAAGGHVHALDSCSLQLQGLTPSVQHPRDAVFISCCITPISAEPYMHPDQLHPTYPYSPTLTVPCWHRYVHGDVKPENLCLGADCNGAQHRLFLLDLGLASRWKFLRTPSSYSQRPDDFRHVQTPTPRLLTCSAATCWRCPFPLSRIPACSSWPSAHLPSVPSVHPC